MLRKLRDRQCPYIVGFLLLFELFQVGFSLLELIGHFDVLTLFMLWQRLDLIGTAYMPHSLLE